MNTVTSRDGTTIAFDRVGEGPALILVNGASALRRDAAPLAEALAPRFTIFNYDRRGRGDSGDTAPYAVEREVEDLAALIEAAGGSAFMFGHSSGAVLALTAASRLPGITKLALYEPPFIIDDTRPPVPKEYVAYLTDLVAAGRRGDAVEYFMTAAVDMPGEAVAQMRDSPMWPELEAVAHTLPYDGAIMGDGMFGSPVPLKRWASVTTPTLVLDGGASPAWMRHTARALVEILPNARQRTLEGQEHGAPPEILAPVLIGFFAG